MSYLSIASQFLNFDYKLLYKQSLQTLGSYFQYQQQFYTKLYNRVFSSLLGRHYENGKGF